MSVFVSVRASTYTYIWHYNNKLTYSNRLCTIIIISIIIVITIFDYNYMCTENFILINVE